VVGRAIYLWGGAGGHGGHKERAAGVRCRGFHEGGLADLRLAVGDLLLEHGVQLPRRVVHLPVNTQHGKRLALGTIYNVSFLLSVFLTFVFAPWFIFLLC